jgi:hypothetical protein
MSEDSLDDGLLVLRCQRGDPEAFREVVNRWEPRLYYYLRRVLGNDGTVWDVLQETWLEHKGMELRLRDSDGPGLADRTEGPPIHRPKAVA